MMSKNLAYATSLLPSGFPAPPQRADSDSLRNH
jgi:hypothetical protein